MDDIDIVFYSLTNLNIIRTGMKENLFEYNRNIIRASYFTIRIPP